MQGTMIRMATTGAGVYAVAVGITTLLAGYVGMDGAAFDQAVGLAEAVHISPPVLWGVAAIVAGVLTLVPQRKVSQWGLYGVAVWAFFFGLTLALSAPPAGYRGVCTYAFVATMISGLILIRRITPDDRPVARL